MAHDPVSDHFAGGTRTCIHTPGAQLAPDDLDDARIAAALDGAALVYFDGRLTEAALRLAAAARRSGVPVLVEGERLRPGLQDLLALADYVVTSANFPQVGLHAGVSLGQSNTLHFTKGRTGHYPLSTRGGAILLQQQQQQQQHCTVHAL
jgi:hypothetical protein